MRYDIAIIGTGPAGLSAAITAKIRNKSVLLIGSKDLSPKVTKAHAIQNYLGLPNIPGADLGAAFQASLDSVGVTVTEDKITAAYNLGDYYGLQGAETIYEASTLILATGMIPGKLLPGEEALLGTNATTIPLKNIGARATLGAGAVALRDIAGGESIVRLR